MFTRMFAFSIIALTAAMFTGCSMMDKTSSSSAAPQDTLVIITGAHGGTATYAYETSSGKAKMMNSIGDMKECSACVDNINNYYKTGKLSSECTMCKSKFTLMTTKGTHGGT